MRIWNTTRKSQLGGERSTLEKVFTLGVLSDALPGTRVLKVGAGFRVPYPYPSKATS